MKIKTSILIDKDLWEKFKEIALKYFTEVKEITQYINKNLSRHILILENKK